MVLNFLYLVSEDRFFYGFQLSVFILNIFDIICGKELGLCVLVGFCIHFFSRLLFYFVLNHTNTKNKKSKIYKIFYTKN
jgi:hypothetical protein